MPVLSRAVASLRPRADGPRAGQSQWVQRSLQGQIPLISSRGVQRFSTYRGIYLTNPWIYASVNKLARDLARMSQYVYEIRADGTARRVRGDVPTTPGRPLAGQSLDRLMAQPDPSMSRFALWSGTATERLVYGNALWEINRTNGVPSSFTRRRWRNVVRVKEDPNGGVLYYEIASVLGGPNTVGGLGPIHRSVPDDVVHFGKGTDPESSIGLSPLESCKYSIALYEGVIRHLVAFFENQAKPSGAVQVENLTREKAELIREMILEAYTSPENAGKVLVTSGEWKQITNSPTDSAVVELIKLAREEAAAVFGVPPPVLGILERAIKSNVAELRSQYVREGLGPWAKEFDDEILAQVFALVPAWRFLFPRFDLSEQLRPDLEALSLVFQRMSDAYTPDDKREAVGLQRLELRGVSDVPWVPSGAMPLTTAAAGKQPKSGAPPAAEKANGHKDVQDLEVTP